MESINEKNEIFENTLNDFLKRENNSLENKLNSINMMIIIQQLNIIIFQKKFLI